VLLEGFRPPPPGVNDSQDAGMVHQDAQRGGAFAQGCCVEDSPRVVEEAHG